MEIPFLSPEPIDAATLEEKIRAANSEVVVTFQSVVRWDRTDEGHLDHLLFEAYEPMVLKEMERLKADLKSEWNECELIIQHRVGRVAVGETSVFIAVCSPRREDAFDACRFAIDRVKTSMPLWKKDVYTNGRSLWSIVHREAMLVSDRGSISIPAS